MFGVSVIASGSSGNALLVSYRERHFLVDAGVSARKLTKGLACAGVAPEQIEGILLTHEHSDHAKGLRVFCNKYDTPVFGNRLTAEALRGNAGMENVRWKHFQTGSPFELAGLGVDAFSVPHDAADPVGFFIHNGGSALCVLTDLGYGTAAVLDRAGQANALLIEANHDEELLARDVHRPWSVKQRIMSRHGHLSNAAAADIIYACRSRGLKRAILGHMSRDCNRAELALEAVSARLDGDNGISVAAVEQDAELIQFEIGDDYTTDGQRVNETGYLFET